MDEQQLQEQIVLLVLAAMQGDQLAAQQIELIMLAAQLGDQQAALIALLILEVAQQLLGQQVQAAKFGAKLNYIRTLRGECPFGTEPLYFKRGGKVCKRCVRKERSGMASKDPVTEFKTVAAKCGKKMRKKACGGTVRKALEGLNFKNVFPFGGKLNRPTTGFEGLDYKIIGGARPLTERVNNGKNFIEKETYYDPDAYLSSRELIPTDEFYNDLDKELDERIPLTRRVFDSLKRHALSNQYLNNQYLNYILEPPSKKSK